MRGRTRERTSGRSQGRPGGGEREGGRRWAARPRPPPKKPFVSSFYYYFFGITLNFLLLTHLNRFGSLGCIGSAFIYFTQIQALDSENRFTNRDEYELKAK